MVQIICKACDRQPHFHIYRVEIVQYHFFKVCNNKTTMERQTLLPHSHNVATLIHPQIGIVVLKLLLQ